MGRVTTQEVKDIIVLKSDITDDQVNIFINQANLYVTNVFSGDTTVSDDILKEIERNIAAHFLHALDPRESEKTVNKARSKYSGKFDLGLNATTYGQNAMMLDPTGKLSETSTRKRATLGVIEYSLEV